MYSRVDYVYFHCASCCLVEDHHVNAKMMVMMMRKLGYEILVAVDGVDALAKLEREAARGPMHEIECILMDASMPNMNGIECTRVIRQQQMSNRTRPYIIAQTANVTDDYQLEFLAAGSDAFLPKPIQLDKLTECLRAAYRALH